MLVFKFPVAVKLLVLLIEAGEALTAEQDAVVVCSVCCELVVVNARDDVVKDVVEMDAAVVEAETFVLLAADVVAVAKLCEFPVVVSIFFIFFFDFIFNLFF